MLGRSIVGSWPAVDPDVSQRLLAMTLLRAQGRPNAPSSTSLEDWPILTRRDVQANADGLLVGDVPRPLRQRVTTGGSTGQPVSVWLDRAASLTEWRHLLPQWRHVGFTRRDWRLVLRGKRLPSGQLSEVSHIRREFRLSTFDLTRDNVDVYAALARKAGARYLHAFPSSALLLARLAAETGVALPQFDGLLLGSEKCTDAQRVFLQEAFGGPVFTWYGQSEKVLLGGECPHSSTYHLWPSYGVAELIDDDGERITEPGIPGRVVGTGFINTCAPLVRYEIGDIATWAEGCPCGWRGQLLAEIEGRTQDALVSRSGQEVSASALNLHDASYAHVLQFQYVQHAPGDVELLVVPAGDWDVTRDEQVLMQAVVSRLPSDCDVRISYVEDLSVGPNGKTPLVLRRDQNQQPVPGSRQASSTL